MSFDEGLEALNRAVFEFGITTDQASEAFEKLAEVANEVAEQPGFREWQRSVLSARFGRRKAMKILKGRS